MKKISFIVVCLGLNLYALDMFEAVQRGLDNSHQLKSSQLSQSVSQANLDKTKSGYRPTLDANYYASSVEQNSPDSSVNPSYISLSLGYNLFNGYKDKYAIKGATEGLKNAGFQKEALKEDIKLAIELAYIDYLEKRKTLSTKEEAVALVQKSLQDTQAYYNQGLVAKNSLLQTKVSLSKTKQDLLVAKSDLLVARESLKRLLGGKLNFNEEIKELHLEMKDIANIENLVKLGLANRSEIKSLKSAFQESKYAYNASKSDLYPQVDFALSYTKNGKDGDLAGRSNAYNDETKASFNLSYNLYKGGAYEANRVASMYKMQIANEKIKTLELDIILQINKAKEAYALALENSKVAKDAQEYALENFSIMQNRYKSQLEKTTDFLQARLDLSEAKIAYTKSLYNIYAKYLTLLRVVQQNS